MCLCFLFLISPVFLFIPKRSSPPEGGQRQPCVRNLKICGCLDFSHSFERTKNKRAHTPVRPYGNKHQQCRGRPMCLPKRKTKEQKNKRAHAGAPIQATDNSNVGADRCVCPKEREKNKRAHTPVRPYGNRHQQCRGQSDVSAQKKYPPKKNNLGCAKSTAEVRYL